jgi:hypothetical protein
MEKMDNGSLPGLLIKPEPGLPEELYYFYEKELNSGVSFRSLDLAKDLDMIHDWVNQSYSRKFWQLNGSKDLVYDTYKMVLENPRAHSFIGLVNKKPVCQIDVYGVAGEELGLHTVAGDYDCGLHLLMLPTRELQKGWSYYALKNFQQFYFTFSQHEILYDEPDQENVHANKLAMDSGFRFIKTIALSNKTANLYSISREQFRK